MDEDSLFGGSDGPYPTAPDELEMSLIMARVVDPECAPRIDRFILIRSVGAGGMGTVFAAFDPKLERKVAVKVLHAGLSQERLLREAQALARVDDRNILTIYDVGEHQGRGYIAMELIEGRSFRNLLRGPRLPWRQWLRMYVEAGRGLDSAHRAGLVHRDFKPENVLLAHDERVVVVDFGLAREAPRGEAAGAGARSARSGTYKYMAPEQLAGAVCDARSDQYSFCTALWEAVHGEAPLAPSSRHDTDAWEAVGRLRLASPRWLRRGLLRGLHPDPARRWTSMTELLDALQRGAGRRRRAVRRALFGLGAVLVALFAVTAHGCVEKARQNAALDQEIRRRTAEMRADMEVMAAAREDDPTIASSLLVDVFDPGRGRLWRNVAQRTLLTPASWAILRGHTAELRLLALSPGAERVATASLDGTIRVWPIDGAGAPRVLNGHANHVHVPKFSPDGDVLASSSRDGTVRVWDMAAPNRSVALVGHRAPVWYVDFSPDGRRLASSGDHGEIFLWERRAGSDLEFAWIGALVGHDGDVFHVEFSPDGRLLVSAGNDGTARIWSVEQRSQLRVLRHGGRLVRAHFSLGGQYVVTASQDEGARLWRVGDGESLHSLGDVGVQDARFDPRGRWVATAGLDGFVTLWSIETGDLVRRWRLSAGATAIVFAPAGEMLAAAGNDGAIQVWPTEGKGGAEVLRGHYGSVRDLAFSRDGETLVSSSNDKTARVWDLARIRRHAARHVVEEPAQVSAVGFDAGQVALAAGDTIRVYELETGRPAGSVDAPPGGVRALVLRAAGGVLVGRTGAGALFRWDLTEAGRGTLVATEVNSAQFLPDGALVVGHDDGVTLYSAAGQELGHARELGKDMSSVSGLVGGRYLAVAGRHGRVVRLDVSQGLALTELRSGQGIRHFVGAGCPDGQLPVWNTREPKVEVWELADDVVVREMGLGSERPAYAALDCHTGLLMATTGSGSLHVQGPDGRAVAPPIRHRLGHGAWTFLLRPDASPLLALREPRAGVRIYEASSLRELASLGDMVQALGVHADGESLWVARDEHGVMRIGLRQLLLTNDALRDALAASTTACPDLTVWREVYLGDEAQARQSAARCEARNGRVSIDDEG